jgi:hypothetical protein
MAIDVLMPALSPTMTEGKIAKWHKKVGESAGIRISIGICVSPSLSVRGQR